MWRKLGELIQSLSDAWQNARLVKVALGKYVILLACLLHFGWTILLLVNHEAALSTPLHVVVLICGGVYRTAFVLLLVACAAFTFPFLHERVSNRALAGMLIPQQLVLLMSAGGALLSVIRHHYADGVPRSGTFILADQLPIILLALLYTVAVLEASFAKE